MSFAAFAEKKVIDADRIRAFRRYLRLTPEYDGRRVETTDELSGNFPDQSNPKSFASGSGRGLSFAHQRDASNGVDP